MFRLVPRAVALDAVENPVHVHDLQATKSICSGWITRSSGIGRTAEIIRELIS